MNFSPFSCPIFLRHPEARGLCSQGERVLYGRGLRGSGGTRKAAGRRNWPEAVPRKGSGRKKDGLPGSVRIGWRSKLRVTRAHGNVGACAATAPTATCAFVTYVDEDVRDSVAPPPRLGKYLTEIFPGPFANGLSLISMVVSTFEIART